MEKELKDLIKTYVETVRAIKNRITYSFDFRDWFIGEANQPDLIVFENPAPFLYSPTEYPQIWFCYIAEFGGCDFNFSADWLELGEIQIADGYESDINKRLICFGIDPTPKAMFYIKNNIPHLHAMLIEKYPDIYDSLNKNWSR